MSPSASTTTAGVRGPRSFAVLAVLAVCTALVFVGLVALGSWQVQRRAWKLDLIDQVTQRIHSPAVAAPSPAEWPQINASADAYRHIRLSGTYLHTHTTLVQASTERGSGFWVITPLQSADDSIVLVNRGFLPPEARAQANTGPATATVTGLLRISEPSAVFPRRNDPATDRWYSRDVAAIAAARGLRQVAPYFVDADAAADGRQTWPLGGLTVVRFQNNHLVYALTWYTLASMVAAAAWYVARDELRLRRRLGTSAVPTDNPHHDASPH